MKKGEAATQPLKRRELPPHMREVDEEEYVLWRGAGKGSQDKQSK
jgi:hypothetical protein